MYIGYTALIQTVTKVLENCLRCCCCCCCCGGGGAGCCQVGCGGP